MLAARIYNRKGKGNIYDKNSPEGEDHRVDMSKYMTHTRLQEIKGYIKYLFQDEARKGHDPWWQFSKAVEDFNKNRKNTVLSSFLKTFDESMSAS